MCLPLGVSCAKNLPDRILQKHLSLIISLVSADGFVLTIKLRPHHRIRIQASGLACRTDHTHIAVSSVRLKVNLVVVEEGHEQSRPGTPQRSPRPWCAPLAAAHDCTRAAIVARFSATYRAMTWLLSLAMCRLLNEEGDAA
jgi:hypothetical protein